MGSGSSLRPGSPAHGLWRPRVPVAVAMTLVVVVAAVYLYVTVEQRRPTEIVGATVVGESLIIETDSCGGAPEVTDIEESPSEVRITAEASTRLIGSGNQCADSIETRLESPLGDRLVVDGTSGEPVEVQGR